MADVIPPASPTPSPAVAATTGADGLGPMLPARMLRRLLGATGAVGSELDLAAVLRQIVESAVTLVQARSGLLGIVDEDADGDALSQLITVGVDEPRSAGGVVVIEKSPSVAAPLRLHDLVNATAVGPSGADTPSGVAMGVPVHVGGTVFGHLQLHERRDGQEYTDDDEQVVGALAVAAGVAIRNARLYEQARRGSAWREAARAISTALLGGSAREAVIRLLAETARGVLSADSMLIVVAGGTAPHVVAASGSPGPPADEALLDGLRPVLRDGQAEAAVSCGLQGFAVPLGPAGQSCPAVMVALWTSPPSPLLAEDLTGFAAQSAVVLELADRRLEAEQGAVGEDRERIGRDLHDLVIQRLFATGMRLQGALNLIAVDPAAARGRVDSAVDELDATIRELRSTIHGLHTPAEGRPSFRARLLELLDAATEQLGFVPSMRLNGLLDTAVPGVVAEHALATVREALSNAARHARATHVEVTVSLHEASLRVVVEDDGVGITAGAATGGLRNLEHRADGLGGQLTLDVGRLGGTRLSWHVPVRTTPV